MRLVPVGEASGGLRRPPGAGRLVGTNKDSSAGRMFRLVRYDGLPSGTGVHNEAAPARPRPNLTHAVKQDHPLDFAGDETAGKGRPAGPVGSLGALVDRPIGGRVSDGQRQVGRGVLLPPGCSRTRRGPPLPTRARPGRPTIARLCRSRYQARQRR